MVAKKQESPWQHNGGMRKGAGRPPEDPENPLDERLMVRMSAAQRKFIEKIDGNPSRTLRAMIDARMAKSMRAAQRHNRR